MKQVNVRVMDREEDYIRMGTKKGKMKYTDESGKTVTREGDMIYEFVYMGMNYRAHMENL